MKYDLKEFEQLVSQGYLRKSEKGDLVLYGYTDKTTFDRHWTQFTKVARGLILHRETGEVVAKPFPKFFNLGEMEEISVDKLPLSLGYKAYEKADGSLGIIFNYQGYWNVATRGSFYSEQSQVAQTMLKQYNLAAVPSNITLLAEIIYPENKIIVNYNGQRKLVLLGAFDRETGEEVAPEQVEKYASMMFMEHAKKYDLTIEQMIQMQKTMPKDQEGFVVRFNNGLRVKIKGDEYLRIAKMISTMSPISFWESMEKGVVKREYLAQLPEEFRNEFEPIVKQLEDQYLKVKSDIQKVIVEGGFERIKNEDTNWRRTVGITLKENDVKHSPAVFPYLLGSENALDKYILKSIRPDGNEMKRVE